MVDPEPLAHPATSEDRLSSRVTDVGRSLRQGVLAALVAIRRDWQPICLRAAVILLTALVSVRVFLFGGGYYEYSDQLWPIGTGALPSDFFSFSPISPNGESIVPQFTRIFLTWPGYVFWSISGDQVAAEKFFILFTIVVFLTAAYLVAIYLARILERRFGLRLTGWRRELLLFGIVFVAFLNPYSLNQNVNGGTWADSLIVLGLAAAFLRLLFDENPRRAGIAAGALCSVLSFLDPDFIGLMVLTAGVAVAYRLLTACEARDTLSRYGFFLLLLLPAVLFALYSVNPTFTSGIGGQQDVRMFSLGSVIGESSNLTWFNSIRLFGYGWSALTFAPPGISVNQSIGSVAGSGSPTQFLLPAGPLTSIWILSTVIVPLSALGSTLFRRTQPLALPASLLFVFGLICAQYAHISLLAAIAVTLTQIPVIGGALGTTIALPDHFLAIVTVALVLGSGVSLANLLFLSTGAGNRASTSISFSSSADATTNGIERRVWKLRRFASRNRAWVAVFVVTLLVGSSVLAGWQALNGSYAPSRAYPNLVPGNGVPASAPFAPVLPPPGVQFAYDFLARQPGSFNIYWPTWGANATDAGRAIHFFDSSEAPKPMAQLPALPSLVSSGLYSDAIAYIQAQGVEYFVLQNTTPLLIENFYGFSTYATAAQELNETPSLEPVFASNGLVIYLVDGSWGEGYGAQLAIRPVDDSPLIATSYSIFDSIGLRPAISNSSTVQSTIGIDDQLGDVSLLGPTYLSSESPQQNVSLVPSPGNVYSTSPNWTTPQRLTGAGNWTLDSGSVEISNWSITDWTASPLTVNLNGSVLRISSPASATVTVSYGPLLTSAGGGITIEDPGPWPEIASLDGAYSAGDPGAASFDAYLVSAGADFQTESQFQTRLTSQLSPQPLNYSAPTPQYSRAFSARLQITISDTEVELSNLTASWNAPSFSFDTTQQNGNLALMNWTLTNWGTTSIGLALNSTQATVSSVLPSTVSLSYGASLTSGPGGIQVPDDGSNVVVGTVCGQLSMTDTSSGQVDVFAVYLSSAGLAGSSSPVSLPTRNHWTSFCETFTAPELTQYFAIRVQFSDFVGTASFRALSFSWSILRTDTGLPFGTLMFPPSESMSAPSSQRPTSIEIQNGTMVNGTLMATVPGSNLTWWAAPIGQSRWSIPEGAVVAVIVWPSGGLNSLRTNVTVDTTGFVPSVALSEDGRTYPGVETVDLETLFLAPYDPNGSTIVIEFSAPVQILYVIILGSDLVILAAGVAIGRNLAGRRRSRIAGIHGDHPAPGRPPREPRLERP
jgi:hypothetical protein